MKKLNVFQNQPKAKKINTTEYLYRLGLLEKEPSLAYLKELQKAHLLHIPFENLDIHYQNNIILDYQKVFDKVVFQKRGGFCYELNGLFYHLLYHLGFDCFVIAGRVWNKEKETFGKTYDHMAVIVDLGAEKWLVDVGFGDGIISPLKIELNKPSMDFTRYWRLEHDDDKNFILSSSPDSSHFEPKLQFTLEEKQLIQFIEMCDYHQTSVDSPFTQKKLITQLTETGRITLTDDTLKIRHLGKTSEETILHEDDFLSKLQHHFKISYKQLNSQK